MSIDQSSAVAPFEQLRQQILRQIADGELGPGSQLPTVRRLAADLGVAPNTVARTYRELEQAGVVRTAGRRGTVVSQPSEHVGEDARGAAIEFVGRMRALGIPVTEALHLVRRAWDAF